MSNRSAVLNKIVHNMVQRGYPNTVRSGDTVLVTKTGGDVLTVSYVAKAVQSPMGGIDSTVSPFLGIGIGSPGALKLKGEAAATTLAAILDTKEAAVLLYVLSGFANDVIIESGADTTELARMSGNETSVGLGS